jgi:predicted nucleic acid-binding protein
MKPSAMLDTNVFNDVLDGLISLESLKEFKLYATHIQMDELKKTKIKNVERFNQLITVFNRIEPKSQSTFSLVLDVSSFDEACMGDGIVYDQILLGLQLRQKRPQKKHESNLNDALIGETAIQADMTLITADSDLLEVVRLLGGRVLKLRNSDERT